MTYPYRFGIDCHFRYECTLIVLRPPDKKNLMYHIYQPFMPFLSLHISVI
jgi:hypothetical protein